MNARETWQLSYIERMNAENTMKYAYTKLNLSSKEADQEYYNAACDAYDEAVEAETAALEAYRVATSAVLPETPTRCTCGLVHA